MNKVVTARKNVFRKTAKRSRASKGFNIAISIFWMVLIAFFVLFPFYILFVTSIMAPEESHNANFKFWPDSPSFESYYQVLFEGKGGHSIPRSFLMTFLFYLPPSIVGVIICSIAAFAFAKMNFKAKKWMFAILLGSMMVPNTMSLIISYLIYDQLYWIDTPLPIMIPRLFGTASIVFFLRQYYMKIPNDLLDSAKIDGMGWWSIFWRLIFPISLPAIVAQFILYFITGYNDYLGPLLYLQSSEFETLQLALANYRDPYYQNWPLRMAACIVAMIPMIVLYLASQKTIMKDMSVGSGIKG